MCTLLRLNWALIMTRYEHLLHRVVVDDPVLSKLGIPLAKINSKCVRKFIPKHEALAAVNASAQILSDNYYVYAFDHVQGGLKK